MTDRVTRTPSRPLALSPFHGVEANARPRYLSCHLSTQLRSPRERARRPSRAPHPVRTRRRRGRRVLDHRQGVGPRRSPSRLHRGSDRPGDPPARGADGARGRAGKRLRRGRHLLGVAARSGGRRGRGPHGVAAHGGLRPRDGPRHRGDRARRPAHRGEGSGGGRTRGRTGPRARAAGLGRARRGRRAHGAAAPRPDGRIAVGHRHRARLRHDHAGRRGRDHRAVRGERHLPRRRRRGHRHAGAMAGEHHQHHPGPAAHLRRGPAAGTGRDRRRHRDHNRPLGGRDLRRGAALPPGEPRARQAAPSRLRFRRHAADPRALGLGDAPEPDRHGELDRPGAHPGRVRKRRARRVHDRGAAHHLRPAALVGPEQRRGHHGRAKPWREEAGPGRIVGLARGAVQRSTCSALSACCSSSSPRSSCGPSPPTRR